ncbi:hypothetical protein [Nitrosopumilus sp. b2]|uniref:hypothetical protein n=1 Tax=Nitrosopumilus sp. b2 TaxID=2109908 RepID=UPI0015F699A3|nr:hypothetical protein [Nitrosopumilus sp. b2]KAF6245812.1 hypothetical protein C6989_01385 [Nitrosopumilus sp. b2]
MSKFRVSNKLPFRSWYYFRIGWSTYFAFIFAAINTITVTYYLAIENIPALKYAFPSFSTYAITVAIIGIPLLVTLGYAHFKKSQSFKSETDILAESNPYYFKLPPGWHKDVLFPLNLLLSQMILKIATNEKPSSEELEELKNIQKLIQKLIDGEMVGKNK